MAGLPAVGVKVTVADALPAVAVPIEGASGARPQGTSSELQPLDVAQRVGAVEPGAPGVGDGERAVDRRRRRSRHAGPENSAVSTSSGRESERISRTATMLPGLTGR